MSSPDQTEARGQCMDAPSSGVDDEVTGLPALPAWRGVYFAVLGIFALWVALLAALPRFFS